MPEYIQMGLLNISQTLIASSIGTLSFLLLIAIYLRTRKNENSKFANTIDMFIESMMDFFYGVGENVSYKYVKIVTFVFTYVLWTNFVGLVGDIIALSVPSFHHYFRPASTDVIFNLTLALSMIVLTMVYGYKKKRYSLHTKIYRIQRFGDCT